MAVVLLFGVIALLGLLYKYNATLFSMGGSAERANPSLVLGGVCPANALNSRAILPLILTSTT